MTLKRVLIGAVLALATLLSVDYAMAQNVTKQVRLKWVLPTTHTDGTPIDAANPLTKVQVFYSSSPITDENMAPTVELPANAVSTVRTVTAVSGSKLYGRVKACNAQTCSDFSPEAVYNVPVLKPGVPTSFVIELVITPTP
jgi:hypothetical protein